MSKVRMVTGRGAMFSTTWRYTSYCSSSPARSEDRRRAETPIDTVRCLRRPTRAPSTRRPSFDVGVEVDAYRRRSSASALPAAGVVRRVRCSRVRASAS
jgi:hypothetical protein